jgi:hypothetical protein
MGGRKNEQKKPYGDCLCGNNNFFRLSNAWYFWCILFIFLFLLHSSRGMLNELWERIKARPIKVYIGISPDDWDNDD